MRLEIERSDYGSGYTVEKWDYYNGDSHTKKWRCNTLEDVLQLVRQQFNDEPERGIEEITDE
jgi:hypothetical protein